MPEKDDDNLSASPEPTASSGVHRSLMSAVSGATSGIRPIVDSIGILAAFAIPFTAVRVLSAAGYDISVALALLSYSSVTSLAVSYVMTLVPVLFNFFAMFWVIYSLEKKRRPKWSDLPLGLPFVYYGMLVQQELMGILIFLLLPLAILLFFWLTDRRTPPDLAMRQNRRWLAVTVITQTIVMITASPLWLPPERLVLDGRPVTAYVLEDDSEIVALFAPMDAVLRIDKSRISERQYCSRDWHPLRFARNKERPACP